MFLRKQDDIAGVPLGAPFTTPLFGTPEEATMPVSKHKRKGKVEGQSTVKGKAAQLLAINKRRLAEQAEQEFMGMMVDIVQASDRRKQADVRSI